VQCSAVQCSAVQCSAVQCSAVQCSAVQCGAVQCGAVQCSQISGRTNPLHTYVLNKEQSTVSVRVASVPRSAEVKQALVLEICKQFPLHYFAGGVLKELELIAPGLTTHTIHFGNYFNNRKLCRKLYWLVPPSAKQIGVSSTRYAVQIAPDLTVTVPTIYLGNFFNNSRKLYYNPLSLYPLRQSR